MPKFTVINAEDNTAVALSDLAAGDVLDIPHGDATRSVRLAEPVAFGHKFALSDIAAGAEVLKYGNVIGVASTDIKEGQHVHTHNVESIRARGDKA